VKARTREMVAYGEACGFRFDGADGRGHYVMSHQNGERVRIAATPGDYRGDDNVKAEMRSKSGVTPERPKSGKYRRGVSQRDRFSMDEAIKDDTLPGTFTTGRFHNDVPERSGGEMLAARAELLQLKAEYAASPSNALMVRIRNLETRIRLEVF
jgi:hypothetical protein